MPLRPVPATSSRAQPLTRVDRLERLSADLDALIYAERLGTRSAPQYDANADVAETIAQSLIAEYRGPRRAAAPMLARQGSGAWF